MTMTIPLSLQGKNGGRYVAIVDDEDYDIVSKFRWCVSSPYNGYFYAVRSENKKTVYMHRFILGLSNDIMVDHIDGDGLNNTRKNIRPATAQQNSRNRMVRHDSRIGMKGISQQNNKFYASIRCQGERIYLGTFETSELAARAYDRKSLELYGEFAYTNFPRSDYEASS